MPNNAGDSPAITFNNSYARLPARFFNRTNPTPVAEPELICLNDRLARRLGLDPQWLRSSRGISVLAGNSIPEGAEPIAMAYAGHQFGGWVPQLGDGRAILLGELGEKNEERLDLQLKGSGPTPYSRSGDGRAWLGPVLREYVVSEAMAALAVPTTRALAAVTTGEMVMRERPLPGAVLARVARSHVRIGTFQYFYARNDVEALRVLADHVIERLYPEVAVESSPYHALLDLVVTRQAELIARWMLVGFIHGVMNTDNMSIAGETIDYGPCAFMDIFDSRTVYSSIDHAGRYAYRNQPIVAQWNLANLAQSLLPLLDGDEQIAIAKGQDAVDSFMPRYQAAYDRGMNQKLGLSQQEEGDQDLASELLRLMEKNHADFTLTFHFLADCVTVDSDRQHQARDLFDQPADFDGWVQLWRQRLLREEGEARNRAAQMRATNPAYIARNHRVEEVIRSAVDDGDFVPFHKLLARLERPFELQHDLSPYAEPPGPSEKVHQTFCGT